MSKNKLNLKDNKNIALVYRSQTEPAVEMAKSLTKWLKDKSFKVFTAPEQKLIPGTEAMKTKTAWDKMAMVIVLGGDGTYLRAVRLLEGRQTPILGFNMGSLGFLTAHIAEDTFKVVGDAINGKMILRPRSMLHAQVLRKGKVRGDFHALNDVVIERGSNSQLINTSIFSENFLVSDVKADGLVISSPSGSTAYNLAAGGPILHPETRALVVTPVAPHSLTSRPLLFPDECELKFKLQARTQTAMLIVDGQKQADLTADDEILVKRSCYDHWTVRSPDHNFFHLLREKLKFGDRN